MNKPGKLIKNSTVIIIVITVLMLIVANCEGITTIPRPYRNSIFSRPISM